MVMATTTVAMNKRDAGIQTTTMSRPALAALVVRHAVPGDGAGVRRGHVWPYPGDLASGGVSAGRS